MARGDQLSRQWKLIQTLLATHYGKTVSDLADELGCTRRTVYRDLETLQTGGFPLTSQSRNNRSYWHVINAGKQQVPMTISIPELMALYFGKEMLRTYRGTMFHDAIESLLSKIKATLPPMYIDYLDRIQDRLDAGPAPRKDYTRCAYVIAELNTAIVDANAVRMVYFSMGRQAQTRRTVHPYRLRHVEDSLYLIAYCTLRKQVRTFAVDRIQQVTVTDENFTIPAGFDLQGFMEDSFGIYQGPLETVIIRFSPKVAGYIRERTWHRSQRLEERNDGAVIFTATVAGIEEISHWILRWGADARVLAPEALRKIVGRHAAAMAANYPDISEKAADRENESDPVAADAASPGRRGSRAT